MLPWLPQTRPEHALRCLGRGHPQDGASTPGRPEGKGDSCAEAVTPAGSRKGTRSLAAPLAPVLWSELGPPSPGPCCWSEGEAPARAAPRAPCLQLRVPFPCPAHRCVASDVLSLFV